MAGWNPDYKEPELPAMSQVPKQGFLRLRHIIGDRNANPPIVAIIPVSRSTWWEGVKTGRFPKPVKLGPRTTAWRAEDILKLIQQIGLNGVLIFSLATIPASIFNDHKTQLSFVLETATGKTSSFYQDGRQGVHGRISTKRRCQVAFAAWSRATYPVDRPNAGHQRQITKRMGLANVWHSGQKALPGTWISLGIWT